MFCHLMSGSQVQAYTRELLVEQGGQLATQAPGNDAVRSGFIGEQSKAAVLEGTPAGAMDGGRNRLRSRLEEKRVRNARAVQILERAMASGLDLASHGGEGRHLRPKGVGGMHWSRDCMGEACEGNDSRGTLWYPTYREGMAAVVGGCLEPFVAGDVGEDGLM